MLTEKEKRRIMRLLSDVGFTSKNIPNKTIQTAYTMENPDVRKYLIRNVSPMKKKKKRWSSCIQ